MAKARTAPRRPAPRTDAELASALARAASPVDDKKPDDWQILVRDPVFAGHLTTYVTIARIGDQFSKTGKEYGEGEVKPVMLREWVGRAWRERNNPTRPPNPVFLINKTEDERPTNRPDVKCRFQVVTMETGLKVPKPHKLPEGQTAEDFIIEQLTSPLVGMSQKNAERFVGVNGEVDITQETDLVEPFTKLLVSEDKVKQSAARKLMAFALASHEDDVPSLLTDAERAAAVKVEQAVRLKPGFLTRAPKYCQDEEQLYKLVLYVNTQLKVTDVELGLSDTAEEIKARVEQVARDYIRAN